MIQIKRAYEKPAKADGYRILIDRLWPRGVAKSEAKLDLWLKEIAPSTELRKWFHQNPDEWDTFRKKFLDEIKSKKELLTQIKNLEKEKGTVTLVYSYKDTERNNAVILQKVLSSGKFK
ncbi:MAG: hypothetical protein B6D44_11335 [Ignavibacteriales bacterium UTCHB2]|jgi:uncharacterized protein YeaO (DUF488 family)|nr:MAG: hypothetical protein BWY38_00190 [Ignavibacteria bacterium ADurb.Bin266]OQY71916.1 MAG: hypothetical protein B6D44_11335 [Ignavibacteriales bacterium UTCHB2]HQI39553.1 DUF488 family protein [Ignavibacteriaceae bacterium]